MDRAPLPSLTTSGSTPPYFVASSRRRLPRSGRPRISEIPSSRRRLAGQWVVGGDDHIKVEVALEQRSGYRTPIRANASGKESSRSSSGLSSRLLDPSHLHSRSTESPVLRSTRTSGAPDLLRRSARADAPYPFSICARGTLTASSRMVSDSLCVDGKFNFSCGWVGRAWSGHYGQGSSVALS